MPHSDDDSISDCSTQYGHKPVLLEEAVGILSPSDGKTYLDCTFGGGGHTRKILESANCRVVAIDRDPAAAKRAEKLKSEYGERFDFAPIKFSDLDKLQTGGYAGILFDFGVSSFQLDDAERGFSFMRDGPLDMRMDNSQGTTALEFIENTDEAELSEVLRGYGQERHPRKVARAIIAARDAGKISTTAELAELIASAFKVREKTHPATRAFQAIRIKINDELGEIERALPKAFDALESGGVLAAISFHSLEDRIVKRFFRRMTGRPENPFENAPFGNIEKHASAITRKPVIPGACEISDNPRSRSAKLRAIKKD